MLSHAGHLPSTVSGTLFWTALNSDGLEVAGDASFQREKPRGVSDAL